MKKLLKTPFVFYKFVCIIFFVFGCWSLQESLFNKNYTLELKVKHNSNNVKEVVEKFETGFVQQSNPHFVITKPTIIQRLFWPNDGGMEPILNLVIIIVSLYGFILLKKLSKNDFLKTNIYKELKIIIACFGIVGLLMSFREHFIDNAINKITIDTYSYDIYRTKTDTIMIYIGIFASIVLYIYKEGKKIQLDQDLTI